MQLDTGASLVVVGVVDLASVFTHEANQCGSYDFIAGAVNDSVENAAEMWEYCKSSVETIGTACSGRCLNIT